MGDGPDLAFAYGYCEALVREGDPERFTATLFAPAEARPHLFALHAFSLEIARVRELISAPLPGEVRHQWWRDALQGEARGDVKANPLAAALDATIVRFRLPRTALVAVVDARTFDLYDDLMPSLNDLEGYCGETVSGPLRLASFVLANGADPGGAEAAGHAGVAFGVTGLLRTFARDASRGQVYVPKDLLDANGVTRDDIVLGRGGPGLMAALADLRKVARRHLERARTLQSTLAPAVLPAFLPLALVEPTLRRMEGRDYDPYRTVADVPPLQRQWSIWRAARRRRF